MPFLIAMAAYAVRIARRPLDARLKKRHAGPLTVSTLGVLLLLAWDRLRPTDISAGYFLGELAGVCTVYLMTLALVLATRLTWLEQWFGGLDRMYVWHKQYALWSMLLLAPHILLTQTAAENIGPDQATQLARTGLVLGIVSAVGLLVLVAVSLARVGRILRLPYERWLLLHRATGLLVLLALVHGWAMDPVIGGSTALRVVYLTMGAVGLAAYGYDELIRRRREPRADYTVHRVERPAVGITDVTLTPTGPVTLPVMGGQFVYLRIGGNHARREHPLSVAGTYPDGSVRLTIRALGRGTRSIYADLREGLPATLTGPYGMFDHTLGGPRQIWIAGGIGIAPFLGWLGEPDDALPRADLFYCAPSLDEAPFLTELTSAASDHPGLRVHPHFSKAEGHLTVDRIEAITGPLAPDTHVFLCGPASLTKSLMRSLRAHGIPGDHLHTEYFAFR
ncbi:ferredoxin reductase family protein [Streptomyces sp. YIM S03343]